MAISGFGRCALSSCVAAGMLAGCGGSPTPVAAPGAVVYGPAVAAHVEPGGSWMLPESKNDDLLYISDANNVYAYSYPKLRLVGTLSGFDEAGGLCVDKAGDVWIGNSASEGQLSLIEYKHGDTKPSKTLADSSEGSASFVSACSVDSTTGNLAAVNWGEGGASNPGNVSVFENASGPPTVYSSYISVIGGAYDGKGDLFVDGSVYGSSPNFALIELNAGRSQFRSLNLSQRVEAPGGVQWDGRHVALGDILANVIYQFTVHGKKAKAVGSTTLRGGEEVPEFWIEGSNVIGPNNSGTTAMIWRYPAGGDPVRTITGLNAPWGAAVSRVSK